MADYYIDTCTCGSDRFYWKQTVTGPQPFCGDCQRLLNFDPVPKSRRVLLAWGLVALGIVAVTLILVGVLT